MNPCHTNGTIIGGGAGVILYSVWLLLGFCLVLAMYVLVLGSILGQWMWYSILKSRFFSYLVPRNTCTPSHRVILPTEHKFCAWIILHYGYMVAMRNIVLSMCIVHIVLFHKCTAYFKKKIHNFHENQYF